MAVVLVIDDDDALRRLVRRILEAEGHAVIDRADGREGVAAARATPVDLVITDIFMPEQEGLDTIREIRGRPGNGGPKIIAMSGGGVSITGEDVLRFAQRFGADAVIAKPFRPAELRAEVARVLAAASPPVPPAG